MKRRCFEGYLEYLKERGGRYLKDGRPDPWTRRFRIMYGVALPKMEPPWNKEHIQIFAFQTPVVTMWANGDIIIRTGGWLSKATAECIREHTNFSVWRNKGNWYLSLRYRSCLLKDDRDACTYYLSHPLPIYDIWAPASQPCPEAPPVRIWGCASVVIPARKGAIIRDVSNKPLLSIAKKNEIDAMILQRQKNATKLRAQQYAKFVYYFEKIMKARDEDAKEALMDSYGWVRPGCLPRLEWELTAAKEELEKYSAKYQKLLNDAHAAGVQEILLRRKLQEYQTRLARWDLLMGYEREPSHERERVITVNEESADEHVRARAAASAG